MTLSLQQRRELRELFWEYHEGALGASEAARLEEFVLGNPEACELFVKWSAMVGDLEWQCASARSDNMPPSKGAARQGAARQNTAEQSRPTQDGQNQDARPVPLFLPGAIGDEGADPLALPASLPPGGGSSISFPIFSVALVLATVIGGGATYFWIDKTAGRAPLAQHEVESPRPAPGGAGVSQYSTYSTRLVNVTNCRWDPTRNPAGFQVGYEMAPGQSLSLLEGIAEIATTRENGDSARFVLEGPLSMVVTNGGLPVLQYGKLAAATTAAGEGIVLDTPLGVVRVNGYGSLGVVGSSDNVVVHVFVGDGVVFQPSRSIDLEGDEASFRVPEGSSLRLAANGAGFNIERGVANERSFVANVSSKASNLVVSEDYVSAVREAKPLAYWRFERLEDNWVKNEMGDRWHIALKGDVGWRDYAGNRAAEFGMAHHPGQLMTEQPFGQRLRDAYTLEAWVKPSHFHQGSFVGLVDWSAEAPNVSHHGLSLELCGPASPWLNQMDMASVPADDLALPEYHPSCFRFLHRSPPARAKELGTSFYSPDAYQPRVWQHIVATKDGPQLRLYVNGKLAAEASDRTKCPDNLNVLIGQNWPLQFLDKPRNREFVGEIDEVAIYDRALSAEEIERHFKFSRQRGRTASGDVR